MRSILALCAIACLIIATFAQEPQQFVPSEHISASADFSELNTETEQGARNKRQFGYGGGYGRGFGGGYGGYGRGGYGGYGRGGGFGGYGGGYGGYGR